MKRMSAIAATTPMATPARVSASRRMGCSHASWGLMAATPMSTAVLIAAVTASPGRPISVTARTLTPISAANDQT